ncbi:MAG TPA: hypothetical protein VJ396_01215 [Acidiferrobacterales bacterium]|nr:hypothetical protein [Acidiferrobacterales bacterium]
MNRTTACIALTLCTGLLLSACSHIVDPAKARQCEALLKQASDQLEEAKVKGFGGGVKWTQAAGLLTAAATQQQFERFDGCINKATRAMALIREAQAEKKK